MRYTPNPDGSRSIKDFLIHPDDSGIVQIMKDGHVYYMGCLMGRISHDMHTFILFRHSRQRVRRHNAYGCSRIFLERLIQLGCRMFIVAVDGKNKYRLPTRDMLKKGIFDNLNPGQSKHVFVPIDKFEVIP